MFSVEKHVEFIFPFSTSKEAGGEVEAEGGGLWI